MKWCAWMVAFTGLSMAAASGKTFTGVIHDNRCVGPNCARQCASTKDPVYTLQSGEDAWVLSGARTPDRYVGQKVVVTGVIEPNNRLRVVSIVPAKSK